MYGSIFCMRVKSSQEQGVIDLFEEWDTKRKARTSGSVGGLLMKPDGRYGELTGMAIFKDKPSTEQITTTRNRRVASTSQTTSGKHVHTPDHESRGTFL